MARGTRTAAAGLLCISIIVVLTGTVGAKLLELRDSRSQYSYEAFYERPVVQRLQANTAGQPPFRVVTALHKDMAIEPGFMWAYGFETADGYVNVYNMGYKQFWAQVVRQAFKTNPGDAASFRTWGNRVNLWTAWENPSRADANAAGREADALFDLDLLSLANVRYVLSPEPIKDSRLRLVGSGGEFSVYENIEVLPRFYLASKTRTFPFDAALYRELGLAQVRDLADTVYLVRPGATAESAQTTSAAPLGKVDVHTYSADRATLDVECSRDCWLVASQTWSPFWTATVDGAQTQIEPAYGAFQCVRLAKGAHRVIFCYGYPAVPFGVAAH